MCDETGKCMRIVGLDAVRSPIFSFYMLTQKYSRPMEFGIIFY